MDVKRYSVFVLEPISNAPGLASWLKHHYLRNLKLEKAQEAARILLQTGEAVAVEVCDDEEQFYPPKVSDTMQSYTSSLTAREFGDVELTKSEHGT